MFCPFLVVLFGTSFGFGIERTVIISDKSYVDDMADDDRYMLRTECEAYRKLYGTKLSNVDLRINGIEKNLEEIKGSIADMRSEIKDEYKSLNGAFSSFTVEFRRQIIYILFISCVILVSVLVGRSVDFGWII